MAALHWALRREKETEGREGGYSQTKALELERVEGAADVRSLRGVERTHLAGARASAGRRAAHTLTLRSDPERPPVMPHVTQNHIRTLALFDYLTSLSLRPFL